MNTRDILYFALLIVLVKVAINQRSGTNSACESCPLPMTTAELPVATRSVTEAIAPMPSIAEPSVAGQSAVPIAQVAAPATVQTAAPAPAAQVQTSAGAIQVNAANAAAVVAPTPKQDPELVPVTDPELSQDMLKQIDATQKQVEYVLPHIKETSVQAAQVRSLKQKLSQLRRSYQQEMTGPIFGPHHENGKSPEHIEKDLLRVVNKLSTIIHLYASQDQEFRPADCVVDGLKHNHALLEKLAA